MSDSLSIARGAAYAGTAIYLFGQAFDMFWHKQNLSFVPEPPGSILYIHSGIYLGALIVAVVGVWSLVNMVRRRPAPAGWVLLLLGAAAQLTGGALDTWSHSRGAAGHVYHDVIWYGFAVVVLGLVRMETSRRSAHSSAADVGVARKWPERRAK